ncbi:4Fe-4S dicluster domain-containing protein [Lachnospiraceae bacterium 48-33]
MKRDIASGMVFIKSCTACAGYGKCSHVCPVKIDILEAIKIYRDYLAGDIWILEKLNSMKSVGKPVDCIECGACSSHCFNGIDVKSLIRKLAMMQSCQRLIPTQFRKGEVGF